MMGLVLFAFVLTFVACSDPAPVSPHPAGKANCVLCGFLGDDRYTIADGQGAHESPDSSSETAAEADNTQSDSVVFADSNLESVVRQVLDRPQGHLTPEDVASLTWLKAESKNIQSLAGLQHFTALQGLNLMDNQIADVGPLAGLIKLKTLNLKHNQIADVGPLAGLIKLKTLNLKHNQIADVGPLANLKNLQTLNLDKNNPIRDLGPLAGLTNLKTLHLGRKIKNLGPLAGLTNLDFLNIQNNRIKSLAPLVANTGLSEGDEVHLTGNPLSDQSINKHIPALRARGVTVHF